MSYTKKVKSFNLDINTINQKNFKPYEILKYKDIINLYKDYLTDYYYNQLPKWEREKIKEVSTIKDQINKQMINYEDNIKSDYNNINNDSLFIASPGKIKQHWKKGKEGYNPFNEGLNIEEKMYIKINKLDINNDEKIISFCNKYGLLGADHHNIRDISFKNALPKYSYRGINENAFQSYAMFKIAVKELKAYIELWGFIREGQLPSISNLESRFIKDLLTDKNNKPVSLNRAKEILVFNINKHLVLTSPNLNLKEGNIIPGSKSKTLLSAAYKQLFDDIAENKRFRKCKNPDCGDWFPVEVTTGKGQKYCKETNCATRHTSLKYRWKEYLKNGKKSIEEVAERLNITKDEVKNMIN